MSWIQTYTNKIFYPVDPRPDDIDIVDIAHALSMLCRFNGHTRSFYSVAQHSVLVSNHCDDPHWGLLHDAAEAYLSDIPRPIKAFLPNYEIMEDNCLKALARFFHLNLPIPTCVWDMDTRLLATEQFCFMQTPTIPYEIEVEPLPIHIDPMPPWKAKDAFLLRFNELWPKASI